MIGSGLVTLLNQWLQDWLPKLFGHAGNYEIIIFGMLLLLTLQRAREGMWPAVLSLLGVKAEPKKVVDSAEALPRRSMPTRGEVILEVKDVTRRFGGLVANNQISGVDTPTSGEIVFTGKAVAGHDSREIARLGMSRSFQHVRLLPRMSVLENVAIGTHQRGSSGVLPAAWRFERKEEERLLAEAARQIRRVGLEEHMHDEAGSLSLGQQRIIEIARALAADPCLLLLDEPAAGLRFKEKEALTELLRKLKAEGVAILLVEHDMDFVMGLVDRIVVMEFGEKIAEGLPEEIQQNERVLAAYLGGVE